tara:strand:+ start:782 stop:1027 length:246 start_codon:yes stop_codon:yes gene_type:complete
MEENTKGPLFEEYVSEHGVLRCYGNNVFVISRYYNELDDLFNDELRMFESIQNAGHDISKVSYYVNRGDQADQWELKIKVG